jgi:hypothetical protein
MSAFTISDLAAEMQGVITNAPHTELRVPASAHEPSILSFVSI